MTRFVRGGQTSRVQRGRVLQGYFICRYLNGGRRGTLECQAGASSGICIRHAECIKKDGSIEDRSGCQSLYIRDALNDNKGIHDQTSCEFVLLRDTTGFTRCILPTIK